MDGRRVLSVAGGVVLLLAAVVLVYQLVGKRVADAPEGPREGVPARPALPDGIEERLARLEAEVSALRRARAKAGPTREAGAAPGEDDRLAAVESVLSTLQQRVAGLEADPLQRGYSYLASENAELRREGINMLDRVARFDPEARAALRSMLSDPSARVREQAAQKLGDLGDKESVPQMVTLLGDPDARTRRRAVQALGAAGATGTVRNLGRNLVSDADEQVREEVAQVLGTLGSPEATGFLTEALKDASESVRREAIASLGKIGATSAAPQLRALYEQNPGRDRLRLVLTLKSLGDEVPLQREVARLSELVKLDADDRVREQAIRDLATIARDSSQPVFSQALEDPSPRVRREAERALR